jgi:hypothetical protein
MDGLKNWSKDDVMDIDENAPITLQINNSKHNIFVHVCFAGHEFDVFTILPKYHLIYS